MLGLLRSTNANEGLTAQEADALIRDAAQLNVPGGDYSSKSKEQKFWLEHKTLSNLLNLRLQEHATIHVRVNLVFVGFKGEGNGAVDIDDENLKLWFEHNTDSLPHSIVPSVTDLAASHEVQSTRIRYQYEYQVFRTAPEVNSVLEQIIRKSVRKEDPAPLYRDAPEQVDFAVESWRISDALQSLTDFLGMNETSYTLYILNPKSPSLADGVELKYLKRDRKATYGYRQGFTTSALNTIQEADFLTKFDDTLFKTWYEETSKSVYSSIAQESSLKDMPPGLEMPAEVKVHKAYGSSFKASAEWAKQAMQTSSTTVKHPLGVQVPPVADFVGQEDPSASVLASIQSALATGQAPSTGPFQHHQHQRQMEELAYLRVRNSGKYTMHADCLVDTWTSRGRISFIDLTAGPFQWGPVVGGEGIRSNRTLPKVPLQPDKTDEELGDRATDAAVLAAISNHELIQERAHHADSPATMNNRQEKDQNNVANEANKETAKEDAAQETEQKNESDKVKKRESGTKTRALEVEKEKENAKEKPVGQLDKSPDAESQPEKASILEKAKNVEEKKEKAAEKTDKVRSAKKRLLEAKERSTKKKKDKQVPAGRRLLALLPEQIHPSELGVPSEVSEPSEAVSEAKSMSDESTPLNNEDILSVSTSEIKALKVLMEEHGCNKDDLETKLDANALQKCEQMRQLVTDLEIAHAEALARQEAPKQQTFSSEWAEMDLSTTPDRFLPQLSATINNALGHVITPSSFLLPKEFPSRVFFHVYLITVDDGDPYDFHAYYNEYKRELLKLKLPAQEFAFSLHRLSMKDDTELALAYSNALRTATVPMLSIDGQFMQESRLYLDSKQLQHALRIIHDQDKEKDPSVYKRFEQHNGDTDGGAAHYTPLQHNKEIPVFLFYQDQSRPVFIDTHYQSRALDNMVLTVRSPGSWESVFACNGRPVFWNLENPLRPLLSATIMHLAGVLPTHVAYSEAHQRTSQNWIWSVGDSPLAYTTSRWHFNTMQADIVHRNYVVGALEEAHIHMAAAHQAMTGLTLTDANFAILGTESGSMKFLMRLWNEFYSSEVDVLAHVDVLDFDAASRKLHRLVSVAKEIRKRAHAISKIFAQYRCHEYASDPTSRQLSIHGDLLLGVLSIAAIGICVCFRSQKKHKPKIN